MAKWRPIETAPKDGDGIVLGEPGDGWAGYWEKTPNHWGEVGWQCEDARQGHFMHRHPVAPTLWQAMPTPKGE